MYLCKVFFLICLACQVIRDSNGLQPTPLIELAFANGTEAVVFGNCTSPLTKQSCKLLDDIEHIRAIITNVVSICERFEGESCVCILEKGASIVSCTCGDGLLPRPHVIPWSVSEELFQPNYGFVNSFSTEAAMDGFDSPGEIDVRTFE